MLALHCRDPAAQVECGSAVSATSFGIECDGRDDELAIGVGPDGRVPARLQRWGDRVLLIRRKTDAEVADGDDRRHAEATRAEVAGTS